MVARGRRAQIVRTGPARVGPARVLPQKVDHEEGNRQAKLNLLQIERVQLQVHDYILDTERGDGQHGDTFDAASLELATKDNPMLQSIRAQSQTARAMLSGEERVASACAAGSQTR